MGILCTVVWLYMLVLLARIVMSWVSMMSTSMPGSATSRINDVLASATEPVLAPVRGMLPAVRMGGAGLDLSPMVVMIVLWLILRLLNCG